MIALQEKDGIIRLARQGLFLRGYNTGAVMLEKIMGYRVHSVGLKGAGVRVCYAGFPSGNLERVVGQVENAGGHIVSRNDNLVEIGGLEYPCDARTVAAYPFKEKRAPSGGSPAGEPYTEILLRESVRDFDLENATAVQVLLFVGELKRIAGVDLVLPGFRPGGV